MARSGGHTQCLSECGFFAGGAYIAVFAMCAINGERFTLTAAGKPVAQVPFAGPAAFQFHEKPRKAAGFEERILRYGLEREVAGSGPPMTRTAT